MDTIKEIWDAILRNKMRTLATGVAVASGLFLLIVLLGASNGIIHTMEANLEGVSLDNMHVYPDQTSKPWRGKGEGASVKVRTNDTEALAAHFADRVEGVAPQTWHSLTTVAAGRNHLAGVRLGGVSPLYAELEKVTLRSGRFLNDMDMRLRRKVVVIDDQSETDLFGTGHSAVGETVLCDGTGFRVVGVVERDRMQSQSSFLAPASTLQVIYASSPYLSEFNVKTKDIRTAAASDSLESDVRAFLAHRLGFDPTDREALWIWSMADQQESVATTSRVLHRAFWIIGLLTLLSGVVGVSNIMLITVKERTREFGIRKALGARPASIIRMVLLESVAITAAFGYVGMLAGIAFCEWMARTQAGRVADAGFFQQQYFIDPTVDLATCVEAMLVLVAAGALAGFMPARRAAHIKPIEALRG